MYFLRAIQVLHLLEGFFGQGRGELLHVLSDEYTGFVRFLLVHVEGVVIPIEECFTGILQGFE